MDEAGTISSTSYRVPDVRNLTIGALVLLGGTVAALPFRRADDPQSAVPTPEYATGPTSAIQSGRELVDFSAEEFGRSDIDRMRPPVVLPESSRDSQRVASAAIPAAPTTPRMIASTVNARPRRDIRLPLTYTDLAVPVQDPEYIQQRFGALAQQAAPRQEPTGFNQNTAQLETPGTFEPLVVRQQIHAEGPTAWQVASNEPVSILQDAPQLGIAPALGARPPAEQPSVPGRLASDRNPARPVETSSDSRTRHWIRQPD